MPREFLPRNRKREQKGNEELFPRTARRVMAGPGADRMMYPEEVGNRRVSKQALRELVERGEVERGA
ncbi:MAG: hypothetical protein NT167_22380 [Verrucomicrobia bacterium]|nr:hypothetical protein [Verrucomicrobiota bacterium]